MQKFVPFQKGKRSTFFFVWKKKGCKKEANQHAVGLLASMEAVYRKAHSTLRESTMLKHCYYSLGERVFRRSWFFRVFWSYGGFSFGALTGLHLPQEPILFPRSLYGSSVHCCSTDFIAKAHWGLNKTVGIFAVPSMHHARSARLPYALYDDKEPFKRSNPSGGFDEKTVSRVTRFRRVWRALVAVISTLASRSSSRLVYFFLQLFLLNKEKVDRSPFFKRLFQSSVCSQTKIFLSETTKSAGTHIPAESL